MKSKEQELIIFLVSVLETEWQQWKQERAMSVFLGKSELTVCVMEYVLLFNVNNVSNTNHV